MTTLTEKKPPSGLNGEALIELPLILLVPVKSPLKNADELWKRDKIQEPLICLPAMETICKNFQQGLNRLGIDWFPAIEVTSVDIIESYVANGFGIGLTVSIPKTKMSPKVRSLGLPGFVPVIIGALWRGKPSGLTRMLLDELQARARHLKGQTGL